VGGTENAIAAETDRPASMPSNTDVNQSAAQVTDAGSMDASAENSADSQPAADGTDATADSQLAADSTDASVENTAKKPATC